MKISFNWLRSYITITESPEEIARLLTQSGLEVSGLTTFEPIRGNLKGLIIGQVIHCDKHPHADKLKVVRVDTGQHEPLHIVCGAPNIQVAQKVIVAPIGTQLHNYHGKSMVIKKVKIRGVLSEGMICAKSEIGIGPDDTGIITLGDVPDITPGMPANVYFNSQPDQILDVDLTPNRADAYSHLGTARELGALLDRSIQYPAIEKFKISTQSLPIQITINDPDACPRYTGIVMRGIRVQPSPRWLSDRLRAIGVTPINNVIDITNFVLHELGQPIHVFDYDQIVGQHIIVKSLQPDTPFVTLEGFSKPLQGTELMVCDRTGSMSMAGIIGSSRTHIHAGTTNIFLESAYFSPDVIRKAAKYHTIITDAALHHERGTDPNMLIYALKRACILIQEIAQGVPASALIDHYPQKIAHTQVIVCYQQITRLLGFSIEKSTVQHILQRLDIETLPHKDPQNSFIASVPPYRVDVRREVDVIEEIARIYGYDRIELPDVLKYNPVLDKPVSKKHQWQYEVAGLLTANGYHEICTNSLTKAAYATLPHQANGNNHIMITNPLSETLNALRTTLVFSGLEVIARNVNRKQSDLKIFEFGKIYHQTPQQYVENKRLGVWLTGHIEAINWIRKPRAVIFQDINKIIHIILRKFELPTWTTRVIQSPFYETGLQILWKQTPLLTTGSIKPSLLTPMHIHQPVFFADIDWEALLHIQLPIKQYQRTSKFPLVQRDISLVLDQAINFEAIKEVVSQQKNALIKSVEVFDVYQGESLGRDQKAYALRFVLQQKDKTLQEKTIRACMTQLMRAFETQLKATIRT